MSDKYWQRVQRRHPNLSESPEKSWKCLCCRDGGFIPTDVIIRYLGCEETQEMGSTAPGYLCNRVGCTGSMMVIEVESGKKIVSKFAAYAVDCSITADQCEWIHKQEWNRIQTIEDEARFSIQAHVDELARKRSMQRASEL